MVTNIEPRLNELLTFTYEIGRYVSFHSAWRARRMLEAPHVAPSMSFEGDIQIGKATARLSFLTRPDWYAHAPIVRCDAPWMRGEPDCHVASDGHGPTAAALQLKTMKESGEYRRSARDLRKKVEAAKALGVENH